MERIGQSSEEAFDEAMRKPDPKTPDLATTIDTIVRDVAELSNRTSPEDWPEAMLVTAAELETILCNCLGPQADALAEARRLIGELEAFKANLNTLVTVELRPWFNRIPASQPEAGARWRERHTLGLVMGLIAEYLGPQSDSRRQPAEDMTAIEQRLRQELWLGHGHNAFIYSDDGEMQCGKCAPVYDYKRAPIADVIRASESARLECAAEAEKIAGERLGSFQQTVRDVEDAAGVTRGKEPV